MAGLPEVIGLLYRADWTRLSLSAELRSEADWEPLPRLPREGRSRWYRAWPGQRQDNGRWLTRMLAANLLTAASHAPASSQKDAT
jgi:hypothetical protein